MKPSQLYARKSLDRRVKEGSVLYTKQTLVLSENGHL